MNKTRNRNIKKCFTCNKILKNFNEYYFITNNIKTNVCSEKCLDIGLDEDYKEWLKMKYL